MAGRGGTVDSRQLTLRWQRTLNPVPELKRAMNLAAKIAGERGLSRQQLVDRKSVV